MEAPNLIDPYPAIDSKVNCVIKRTSRHFTSPYEQLLRALVQTQALTPQSTSSNSSSVTDGYPSLSIENFSVILPTLKRWTSNTTSPVLARFISKLCALVDTNQPYTLVKVDPDTLVTLNAVIVNIQSFYEQACLRQMLLRLYMGFVKAGDFVYVLDEQTAVPTAAGIADVINVNTQAALIWQSILNDSCMDIGYVSSGYSTIGSGFFEQYCDLQPLMVETVTGIRNGALVEYANALPQCTDPNGLRPTTWDLATCPNIIRVLGDWIVAYQKSYPVAARTTLMSTLWSEDLKPTNWNTGDLSYGFGKDITTEQRWTITKALINEYIPIGISLRRRKS